MNECLVCGKPVGVSNGLQFHNKCEHFIHYMCLGCDDNTLNGIKSGVLAVYCACKKCPFSKKIQADLLEDENNFSNGCCSGPPTFGVKKLPAKKPKDCCSPRKRVISAPQECCKSETSNADEEDLDEPNADNGIRPRTTISIDIIRSVAEEKHTMKKSKKSPPPKKSPPCGNPPPCKKPPPCEKPGPCKKPGCEKPAPCKKPHPCEKPAPCEIPRNDTNESLYQDEENDDKCCQCTGSTSISVEMSRNEESSDTKIQRDKRDKTEVKREIKTKETKSFTKTSKKGDLDKRNIPSSESAMFVRQKETDQSLIDVLESVCHTVKNLHLQIRQLMGRIITKSKTGKIM